MPSEINYYAFCSDYSDMAGCLFAIQAAYDSGAYSSDTTLMQMIRVFDQSEMRTLYIRTITILQKLDGVYGLTSLYLPGDFTEQDFYAKDFDTGYLRGDFADDYSDTDYDTGFLDLTNTGFSSTFQTILNIFQEFIRHIDEISVDDITILDNALITVIQGFEDLEKYLHDHGENPCEATQLPIYNNSPDILLQAAGADGSDGVPAGIHLRWTFGGDLGLNHLPTGDHYSGTGPFNFYNKANDFITISRTPYANNARFTLDFQLARPAINYAARLWTYTMNQSVNGQPISNRVTLTFTDAQEYATLATSIDPVTDALNFIKAYSGIITLQVPGKSLFIYGFGLGSNDTIVAGNYKIESQSTADFNDETSEIIYSRTTIAVAAGQESDEVIPADNTKTIQIKKQAGAAIRNFTFETYNDFLVSRVANDWTTIGDNFSLTTDSQTAYDRLETADYPVDGNWPQYNDGTTVRVDNYRDKFATSYTDEPSISEVVSRYFELSETDPRAIDALPESLNPDTTFDLQISYVDMLNLVAADYHIARMLGMGCIDAVTTGLDSEQFIYRMTYVNKTSLTDSTIITRSYFSLPTSRSTNLLPSKPSIRPVTYQLPTTEDSVSTGFDQNGYSLYDRSRMINIGRALFSDEIDGYDFFSDLTTAGDSNIFANARPVYYGIEYRPSGQTAYAKPEITQENSMGKTYYAIDPSSSDPVAETILSPDSPDSLYLHLEKTQGVHYYAIYGVNWFSRASVLSDEVATDDTEFPAQNTLQPPTGVAVQYVQPEDPLIFTTGVEQQWLAGRSAAFPGQDIYFTRINFDWIEIFDVSYLTDTTTIDPDTVVKADKMHVYFDRNMPVIISGTVQRIVAVPGSDSQFNLTVAPYKQIDGSSINPAIDSQDYFRFNNSLLSTTEGQFKVVSVTAGGTWPLITIEKVVTTATTQDPDDENNYGLVQSYTLPGINSRFSMVENLSNPENWDPIVATISIHSFADPEHPTREISTDPEGNQTTYWIGGKNADNALVKPLFGGPDPELDMPGYYQVDFPGYTLDPHPQINLPYDPLNPGNNTPGSLHGAHVEWYKGWIRLNRASSDNPDKKQLEVMRINTASPLQLYVFDPTYNTDPIATSGTGDDQPLPANFHPGYRAYLFAEPSPNAFNGSNLLPDNSTISKKTLLGLAAADERAGGSGFISPVSLPATLLARRVEIPVQFALPTAASYKVRPDATWKAAMTFDLRVAPDSNNQPRNPFGFKFCRTSDEDIFEALYSDTAITAIKSKLATLPVNQDFSDRLNSLVNLKFPDGDESGIFPVYGSGDEAYGFPSPDKPEFTSPDPDQPYTVDQLKALYANAIIGTILPLNLQTPILTYIRTGKQTSNGQPVITDAYGNLLDPTDPNFDPFPMIRKYVLDTDPNSTYLRFTDYTLVASSRRLFFYAAAEVTSQLTAGALSEFMGPVTILNTQPPEAPVVRNFTLMPSQGLTNTLSVNYQVAPLAPYDLISSIEIFRTTDADKSNNLLAMDAGLQAAVGPESLAEFTVTDDFMDMAVVPYGQQLFCRLVGLRVINNEFGIDENVYSEPSAIATITLIDMNNPAAPALTYTAGTNTLSWTPVIYNGNYYVFQQNAKGNWTLLASFLKAPANIDIDYPLANPLVTEDNDGNRIYNRFKVKVQNASGLFNLTDNELTV